MCHFEVDFQLRFLVGRSPRTSSSLARDQTAAAMLRRRVVFAACRALGTCSRPAATWFQRFCTKPVDGSCFSQREQTNRSVLVQKTRSPLVL